ncbi:MAG TPA: ribokinase [Acidimicrobiaceae bacterium]|nr:ribokinase [Acidimicrobiaceae bacterium]
MTERFDVCVVGSANLDLVATVERLPGPGETVSGTGYAEYPGGKGLNQAVAAARGGARTAFVGAVGRDAAGTALLQVMTTDGIATDHVAIVDEPTGRALIGVSSAAENSIIVVPGANATVTAEALPPATVVLAQLEVPVDAVRRAFTAARAMGAVTVLNPAPAASLPDDVLALCDIVVPNEHEVELLGGVDHLLALGVASVVVTLGARGAALHTPEGDTPIAPFAVTPVDTTGAGDTFCGSLCARLAAGDALLTALRYAAAAGALCTTRAGAVPSIPTATEVRELLGS